VNFSRLRRGLLVLAAAAIPAMPALADTYPSRPIKVLVGFAAGSAADTFTRIYAQKLSEMLNTPVIVENRPGAGQITAIRALQAAPADGYTLYLSSGSSMAQGPGLRNDLPYDPLRDFSMISYLADLPGAVMVTPGLPVKNMAELIAYAKANPGKLNFGSSGVGSAGHLAGELFMARTGTKMLHIPYKADTEAAKEVAAGTLQVAFTTLRTAGPLMAAGKIRAVAVNDSRPHPQLPGVPPVTDTAALKDMVPYSWYALVGHPKLPEAIVHKLSEASAKVAALPDYVSVQQTAGVNPGSSSPAQLRSLTEKEIAKWREVGKTVKIEF
jgi:tripartite-type tricarboxylate transporter receptor subunit TctC